MIMEFIDGPDITYTPAIDVKVETKEAKSRKERC